MHKHWFTFDISEISCMILICINDLFLYICLLVLELNGSHQHSPWSICDSYKLNDYSINSNYVANINAGLQ